MKVLLIDDEEDIRKLGKLSLEAVGKFDTTVAASGAAGVVAATADPPDVILLDVMMPEMDGLATYAELVKIPTLKNVPIILITAKVQRSEIAQYLAMGAAGIIPKPFDPMTLPSDILKIFRRST